MKNKSTPRRRFGNAALKFHAFLFAVFEAGIAANILITVSHPSNLRVSFETFKMMIMQSLAVSLIWAMVLIGHFTVHQLRSIRRQRHQQAHLDAMNTLHDRYVPSERLDLESVEDDDLSEEDRWRYAEDEQRKEKHY